MPYCSSCGAAIPDGQGKSCSMCYGDPFYGKDGYYLQWLENQEQEKRRKAEEKELKENEVLD
jgi:hypothetical protein